MAAPYQQDHSPRRQRMYGPYGIIGAIVVIILIVVLLRALGLF